MSWGQEGMVWFRLAKGRSASFGLQPESIGRTRLHVLSPGPFVFEAKATTQALGNGLSAWYRVTTSGFEQGFTVASRPFGAGKNFSIVLGYAGGLRVRAGGGASLDISDPTTTVMTYGALRATDATGRSLSAHFSVGTGRLRIVVSDTGAAYPITVDPFVAPSSTPIATFTGSSGEGLGSHVALSADGQMALVSAPGAASGKGAVYIFEEAGGSWSTTPAATLTGSSSVQLGGPLAVSADGQTVLVGAEAVGPQAAGAAYIFEEAGGRWSTSPVATFAGSQSEQLGSAVALSADGQTALVGAFGADGENGAAYAYNEAGGSWSTTPVATFTGNLGEGFGNSVALSADGKTALIGSPEGISLQNGAAFVYTETGGSWSTTPDATFTGSLSDEDLGTSVALSADGRTAIVGAGFGDAAYVYDEAGTTWSTSPAATFSGESLNTPHDSFGDSVALSADGQTALVGAPLALDNGGGVAAVYSETGSSWSTAPVATFTGNNLNGGLGQSVTLSADGQTAFVGSNSNAAYLYAAPGLIWSNTPATSFGVGSSEELGESVALSADGQTALMGAPSAVGDDGAAYVFSESGSSWSSSPVATLAGSSGDYLGQSVALSADGKTALVGAPGAGTDQSGAAYLYVDQAGTWSKAATFSGSGTNAEFGYSVALSADGQTVLVGADGGGPGAAYLYTESAGSWPVNPTATFTTSNESAEFGASVALSADGHTVLIGSPQAPDGGAAFLYVGTGGSWSAPDIFRTGDLADFFGTSVALSADGQTALVGSPGTGGAGYLYRYAGGSWSNNPTVTFLGNSSDEYLGYSVALSADGQTALVGDPLSDGGYAIADLYNDIDGVWAYSGAVPTITFSNSSPSRFGWSVALSADGQVALVGADGAGTAYVYAPTTLVTLDVSGSQTAGSSVATFSDTNNAPTGVEVGGVLTCSTVDGGTPIKASLGTGTYTIDGQSCSGVALSGPDASDYNLSYVGVNDGFVVSPSSTTTTSTTTMGPTSTTGASTGGGGSGGGGPLPPTPSSSTTTPTTTSTTSTTSASSGATTSTTLAYTTTTATTTTVITRGAASPRVRLESSSVTFSNGHVSVDLSCKGTRCAGAVEILEKGKADQSGEHHLVGATSGGKSSTVVLAKGTFSIAAGKNRTIELKVTPVGTTLFASAEAHHLTEVLKVLLRGGMSVTDTVRIS